MTPPTRLPPDYHMHTKLCKHAEGRVIDYARVAREKGIMQIACAEHCPAPEPFSPNVRMSLDEFSIYLAWIGEARSVEGVEVLLGIEADYYEDCEVFLSEWLPRQSFDYVLGSVHFLEYDRQQQHALRTIWDSGEPEEYWAEYFQRIARMADTQLYDVASHLDLPKRYGRVPSPGDIAAIVKPALDRLAAADMGIEINTSGMLHTAQEQYPSYDILCWARERGIPICFGSDAHQPQRVGDGFEKAVEVARAAGYTQRAEYRQRRRTLVPL